MLCSAKQAVHKNEFAHGPANGLDEMAFDAAHVVQQRDVGREFQTRMNPARPQREAQRVMKHHRAIDAVATAQNQRIAAGKACDTIERDIKRPRRYGSASLDRIGNTAARQAVVIADEVDRDVKSVRQVRLAGEPIGATKMLRGGGDAPRGGKIGEYCEEQPVQTADPQARKTRLRDRTISSTRQSTHSRT
jgi:hypothetical protein